MDKILSLYCIFSFVVVAGFVFSMLQLDNDGGWGAPIFFVGVIGWIVTASVAYYVAFK